jgi:hypothetical protein
MIPKKTTLILCIALLISFIVPGVSAEVLRPDMVDFNKTVAYSDLGLTGQQDIQVWVSDVLVMTGNTSAGSMPQPVGDYHVIVKPSMSNRWINNPGLFFTDAIAYLLTFALPLFMILGLIGAASALSSYGRRR